MVTSIVFPRWRSLIVLVVLVLVPPAVCPLSTDASPHPPAALGGVEAKSSHALSFLKIIILFSFS